jgi:redox-sensitive bicupin YhaK (pirin superfamily)
MPRRGPNGLVNGFQLWVNLPAAQKMSPPRYQEVSAGDIPSIEQNGVTVRVVAGEYGGIRGPVGEIAAQPLYMDVTLEPGAEFSLAVPEGHTAVAYLFEGEAQIGLDEGGQGEFVRSVAMVVFAEGDQVRIQAGPGLPARFMLMAGAPFHEPIVPYGPFVMNTQEEIQQVFLDLRNGTFAKG